MVTSQVLVPEVPWMALAVYIITPAEITVEESFDRVSNLVGEAPRVAAIRVNGEQMAELRDQGCTWVDIGERFGVSRHCAFKRVANYRKRLLLGR